MENDNRSKYIINLQCDINTAENIIQDYLTANQFQLMTSESGEQYYLAKGPMMARCFIYIFNGQTVEIQAWIPARFKKGNAAPLDAAIANPLTTDIAIEGYEYKKSLDLLFQQLQGNTTITSNNINQKYQQNMNANINPQYQQNMNANVNQQYQQNVNPNVNTQYQQNVNYQSNQGYNTRQQYNSNVFQQEIDKKGETMCIVGFVLSLVGAFLALFGGYMGAIIYILVFYFAYCGLKTRKKGLAIATLIISGISIVIMVTNITIW